MNLLKEQLLSKHKNLSISDITLYLPYIVYQLPSLVFIQLKKPSHPSRGIPTAINSLSTLLKEPVVRTSFVQADGIKLLVPLITPASTQQSIQV